MKEIFLKIRYFEKDYQKVVKTLTSVFVSNLVSFNGQDYEIQKGCGTSD